MSMTTPKSVRGRAARRAGGRRLIVLAIGIAAWWLLPDQLGLLTRIAITALLVLSLDLVVGIAGLATLGHAALFGVGAYAAGIFALRVHPDPLLGLQWASAAGAVLAWCPVPSCCATGLHLPDADGGGRADHC